MRRTGLIIVALVVVGGAGSLLVRAPPGPRSIRSFDPDRMAELELGMWRAYYGKERLRLFAGLVTLLREQYRTSWAGAARAGFHLSRAAVVFGDARSDYERVLPDLERGYALLRRSIDAPYDPATVARAELAWWVARRDPARSSAEEIGSLIAALYGALYDVPEEATREAGLLRAAAAAVRDAGGKDADWAQIGELLRRSYRSLHRALNSVAFVVRGGPESLPGQSCADPEPGDARQQTEGEGDRAER